MHIKYEYHILIKTDNMLNEIDLSQQSINKHLRELKSNKKGGDDNITNKMLKFIQQTDKDNQKRRLELH